MAFRPVVHNDFLRHMQLLGRDPDAIRCKLRTLLLVSHTKRARACNRNSEERRYYASLNREVNQRTCRHEFHPITRTCMLCGADQIKATL